MKIRVPYGPYGSGRTSGTMYIVIDCICCALLLQSRSQLLHRTLRSRLKPSDVFREQRERRRIVNNKKLASKTQQLQHYTRSTAGGAEELCGLLSDAVQCDPELTGSPPSQPLIPAVNGCCSRVDADIPSSNCASADFVPADTTALHQLSQLAYNMSTDIGSEAKLNTAETFSKHLNLEAQFPTDNLETYATMNGGCVTYDRYVMLLMSYCLFSFYMYIQGV